MIISICGDPGSGKTSVAKLLATHFGWPWYSMGDLRGKLALERGITIDELNRQGETDPVSDNSVDKLQNRMGESQDNFVIEGRLSWYFIPRSFKVMLVCDSAEAARRIFKARENREPGRDDEPVYGSVEDVQRELEKRVASDQRRYEKHYGIKGRDPKNFDLVIDTTNLASPEETVKLVLDALNNLTSR